MIFSTILAIVTSNPKNPKRESMCVLCVCLWGQRAEKEKEKKKEREKEICNLYIKRTEKARQGEKWRRSWEGAS